MRLHSRFVRGIRVSRAEPIQNEVASRADADDARVRWMQFAESTLPLLDLFTTEDVSVGSSFFVGLSTATTQLFPAPIR